MPVCPHCVAQAVIAIIASIPVVAFGIRAIKAKYKNCGKGCDCVCHGDKK